MDQDKREPDYSTNVPHGMDAEPGGPADVEREKNQQANEPIERSRETQQDSPTTLRTGEPKFASTIEKLNEFVRGELASVETYDLALKTIKDPDVIGPLRQIRDSHDRRVKLLREKFAHWVASRHIVRASGERSCERFSVEPTCSGIEWLSQPWKKAKIRGKSDMLATSRISKQSSANSSSVSSCPSNDARTTWPVRCKGSSGRRNAPRNVQLFHWGTASPSFR